MRVEDPSRIRPMLASLAEVPLASADYAYERKYDGVRTIAAVEPSAGRGASPSVRLFSRLGNDKTATFPEVVAALTEIFRKRRTLLVLDGEVVALDQEGHPVSFLHLQGRVPWKGHTQHRQPVGVAFIAFDLLIDGASDLRSLPLTERRQRLERVLDGAVNSTVRLSPQTVADGRALHALALEEQWEGLVAKRLASRYASGRRTTDWYKVKLTRQQTCIVGGWTTPRGTRHRFGALLLGIHDEEGRLRHVGQVGTGFPDQELDRVWRLLGPLATTASPFVEVPAELRRAHWVKPRLVCDVRFTEWTLEGRLRHPVYLGMRDDIKPGDVQREPQPAPPRTVPGSTGRSRTATAPAASDSLPVLQQIDAIEATGGRGVLTLPDGERLAVTNLGKVFWPALKLTKGDLMRHYVRVADAVLPVLADRPLVMQRYPDGVDGKPFYQHRAAARPPTGVRVASVETGDGRRPHVVGGSLLSLLYTAQLGAISQDPWFSRLDTIDQVDVIAIDLDPPDDLPFARVLDMARWVRDEFAALGAHAFAKSSGARGLHIFVPMQVGTPYEAGLLYAQIVATMVARKHSRHGTVERSIAARGRRIYLDYLQNMRGKTLASAYSARANGWAGVSTPLTWEEVESGISPRDFTVPSFPVRLREVGDLWAAMRQATPADVRAVMRYAEP